MNFEQFKLAIETLEKIRERSHAIYQLGIDLINYDELNHIVISTLLESVFSKEGKGWIDWYLYERVGFSEKNNLAIDENGDEICHNIESLWQTVKPYRNQ